MNPRPAFSRAQRTVIIYGITAFIMVVFICQLWLVTATVNAYLGGDDSVVWPAALASFFGLALNAGLLRSIYHIERSGRRHAPTGPRR